MGKADRERRRANEKKRQHGGPSEREPWRPALPEQADALWAQAVGAYAHDDRELLRHCTPKLIGTDDQWRRAVDRMLMPWLERGVSLAWRQGWQPAEVVRHVTRELGKRQARMAADAVAAQLRRYSPATVHERFQPQPAPWWERDDRYPADWCERENVGRDVLVATAVEVLAVLHTLPTLQKLCPPPGEAAGRADAPVVDERMLRKVRGLLDKAESTEFDAEAEALTARAQQLMGRYSIDAALLAESDEPGAVRLAIDDPYAGSKALLLQVVAEANRCRAVWFRPAALTTVVGFPADLRAVEMLFTSLLVQATTAMVREGTRRYPGGGSRTRSFRQAFLASYTERVGERLRAATGEAVHQAAAETGRGDLLPVLAARTLKVDDAVSDLFPEVVQHQVRRGRDREGWAAGRAAADRAHLGAFTEVAPPDRARRRQKARPGRPNRTT